MENQQCDPKSVPDAVLPDAQPARWVAPLHSIRTFSIAEFTQNFSSPGNDGGGTFTHS